MQTTITITEDLLRAAKEISGKSDDSEAIVTSLEDYTAMRKRLALLEDLFDHIKVDIDTARQILTNSTTALYL